MIHELRIYSLKPGTLGEVAKNSGEVGRAIRGDKFGKLEGYWLAEIGPLNQVIHLWSYKDLGERGRLRAELAKDERWNKEYIPLIRPHLLRQDIRLMNPVVGINPPASQGSNIYEMRYYRMRPGGVREWMQHFTAALPVREKYSKIVGLWNVEAGQPNEVVHFWAYPSLNARMEARAAAMKDPGWQEFLQKGGPVIDEMHCAIMIPAAHSPLK